MTNMTDGNDTAFSYAVQVVCEEFEDVLDMEVAVEDSIFDLGAYSLSTMRAVSRINARLHCNLTVQDAFKSIYIGKITEAALSSQDSAPYMTIPRTEYDGPVELSFAQGRLWFLDRLYPGSTWYLMPYATRFHGSLSLGALETALHAIEQRHETLRTTFGHKDGVAFQTVHPFVPKHLRVVDIPSTDAESALKNALQAERTSPFDLERESGWRTAVFRLAENEHVLSLVMHHIISDGWSINVLQRELEDFYSAALDGRQISVEALPVQYRDFAIWQRQDAQTSAQQRQLEYWAEQLEGSQAAEILSDFPRPDVALGAAAVCNIPVQGDLYKDLHRFCQVHQTTPFAVLLAAFRAAHYRFTNVDDANISIPSANRNRQELEGLIGFFVNLQCIRITISETDTFADLVRQVSSTTTASHAYQDVPFERIVARLQPDGPPQLSRNPLAQIGFAVHSQKNLGRFNLTDLTSEPLSVTDTTRFDIELHFYEEGDHFRGILRYATALYTSGTIQSLTSVFLEIVRRGLTNPTDMLGNMPLTDNVNTSLSIIHKTDYPRNSTIPELFRQQVSLHPDTVAVKDTSGQLTYAGLDQRSDSVAIWLSSRNCAPETIVAVYAPRSCETVAALLGILKAGLAYLPLDVNDPPARLNAILDDLPGSVLVLHGSSICTPDVRSSNVEFCTIADAMSEQHVGDYVPRHEPTATSLACVIFTSGSTGRPKGVMIEHRSIIRLVKNNNIPTPAGSATRFAHLHSLAFDAASWELYTPLLNGGTVVCIDHMTVRDVVQLGRVFHAEDIRATSLTPALLKECLQQDPTLLSGLETIQCGGDRLDSADARKVAKMLKAKLINAYGPTENTVVSTLCIVSSDEQSPQGVAIGRSISNSAALVMDSQQRVVPAGVLGELVVIGDGLARGYTDPVLDKDRFVEITINDEQQSHRAYRTGDRVRYRPADGQIEFFGRMDHQVKLRGHRIELAEIEHCLLAHNAVRDAVTILHRSGTMDAQLLSFVTLSKGYVALKPAIEADILTWLKASLPLHMIPSRIEVLERMPMSNNDKVDRRALAQYAQRVEQEGKKRPRTIVPPRDAIEAAVCKEFCVAFACEVGIADNFFDLGGHSLLATRVVSRINSNRSASITVRDIFDCPVVRDLAERVAESCNVVAYKPIEHRPYAGPVELSVGQGRLWFIDQLFPGATWYLIPFAVRLRGSLDLKALEKALQALQLRHEPLRTTFEHQDGKDVQVIHPFVPQPLRVRDFASSNDGLLEHALRIEQSTPFRLEKEPGWRAAVFCSGNNGDDHVLSLVMHHIISDGWSMDVLQRELGQFYRAAIQGEDPCALTTATPLVIQYRDFALWQRQSAQASEHERQLQYWVAELDGSQAAEFLCDKPRPESPSGKAIAHKLTIEGSLFHDLKAFCKVSQTTPFVVLFAAFRAAHFRLTGVEDAIIATPTANRNRKELEGLIGFFVNLQCIRTQVQGEEDSFHDLVQQVMATTTKAHGYQDVPFDRIVAELRPGRRDMTRSPLAQIVFGVHSGSFASTGHLDLAGVAAVPMEHRTMSRFDLEAQFFEEKESFRGIIRFAVDLFEEATIQLLSSNFLELLRRGLADPNTILGHIPLTDSLSALDDLGGGLARVLEANYPRDASVTELFREQVKEHPYAIAVKDTFGPGQLSYLELDQQSDFVAAWLLKRLPTASQETIVGVYAPRSCEAIVAFMGILKANFAYLPLDIAVPTPRLDAIFSSLSGPNRTLVLCGSDLSIPAIESTNVDFVSVTDAVAEQSPSPSLPAPGPTSLAYVIFTSGTSGRPKGVMIEHRGIVRLVKNTNIMSSAPTSFAHISNLAFDMATWEIYAALLNGGMVVCIDQVTVLDVDRLAKVFHAEQTRATMITPAFLQHCLRYQPAALCGFHTLLCGGERLNPQDALDTIKLLQPHGTFVHVYGPTENTVLSIAGFTSADEKSPNGLPLGLTIANSAALIMDSQQCLVPPGVLGELVLTGDGVARGYTDPSLDENRFIEVTVYGVRQRAYRTGDRARYRPTDGQIEFFGRNDYQVKLRGNRIELPEIEFTVLKDSAVSEAVALVRSSEAEDALPELVCYVSTVGGQLPLDLEERLRHQLRANLPAVMVPSRIVVLDRFPVNNNGKIDRQALAQIVLSPAATKLARTVMAPRNSSEEVVCQEIADVFRVSTVGIDDNFFDLGGHSLIATRIVSRINRRLHAHLTVRDIFDYPVLGDLAMRVVQSASKQIGSYKPITHQSYTKPVELSYAQSRLWFLDRLTPGSWAYNMPFAVRLRGALDLLALEKAVHALEERHETLRTTFEDHGNGTDVQAVHPFEPTPIKVVNLCADIDQTTPDGTFIEGELIENALRLERERPFKLDQEHPWRVVIFRVGRQDDHVLSVVMHHIASDGWSADVLRRELADFYAAAVRGQDPLSTIDPLPIQYRDFAIWQRQGSQVAEQQIQLEYWATQLEGSQPAEFLYDKRRPAVWSGKASAHKFVIEAPLYQNLRRFCQHRQTTPFTVLLAAFRAAHFRLTGAADAVIGCPNAGRNRYELENIVGFFVNLQCIRTILTEEDTFDTLVQQVSKTTAASQANQDVPFERIVAELRPGKRDAARNPLAQIIFALHSQEDLGRFGLPGLEEEVIRGGATTRFDMEMHVFEQRGSLRCNLTFAEDLFEPQTVKCLAMVFLELLRRGLGDPTAKLMNLPLTDGVTILSELGLGKLAVSAYPRDASLPEVFRRQVDVCPNRTAVKDSTGAELSYTELDFLSSTIAWWLTTKRALPAETPVGLYAARSCETVVAALGILKAGLAYVPLDVNSPSSRLDLIFDNFPGHMLVFLGSKRSIPSVQSSWVEFVPITEALTRSAPDTFLWPSLPQAPRANSLAHVIFTSGSTGRPKGVMIEHRGIVRLVTNSNLLGPTRLKSRLAHVSNLAFDAASLEIFGPLLNGGTIICVDYATMLDAAQFGQLLRDEQVQIVLLTPAYLKQCLQQGPELLGGLETLIAAGDRFDPADAVTAVKHLKADIVNAYGPTENSVLSSGFWVPKNVEQMPGGIPIGMTISNSGIVVMDSELRPVPPGVLGEVVVFGDGLARGYTDTTLNKNRFVCITIDGTSQRAYRTGDRARFRPTDGALEFFGRLDFQVKLRGNRVELPEIEQTLISVGKGMVRDAVALVHPPGDQNGELLSFVTLTSGSEPSQFDTEDQQLDDENQVSEWLNLFDQNYETFDASTRARLARDFKGWNSKYDRKQIDIGEMNEWLDDTLASIRAGGSVGHVLEVGTGSGLVLFNLYDGADEDAIPKSYVGVEPSPTAVEAVNKAVRADAALKDQVKVHVGTAADVKDLSMTQLPSLVIINSVAQYFPSAEYLTGVIETLLHMDQTERIFIGDVRSWALHNEVSVTKAMHILEGKRVSRDAIRKQLSIIKEAEEELLIHPSYFTELVGRMPTRVSHVEVIPKRMRATNELSSYRYAVVIHVKRDAERTPTIRHIASDAWIDFEIQQLDRQKLLQLLREADTHTAIPVSNIPNAKTNFARHIVDSLHVSHEAVATADEWLRSLQMAADAQSALSAHDLASLAREAGCRVEISWARQRSLRGGFDAVFHKLDGIRPLFDFPVDEGSGAIDGLTNRPLGRHVKQKTESLLRRSLQAVLPAYMVPARIITLESLPQNANGKVDRHALVRLAKGPEVARAVNPSLVRPRTDTEEIVCNAMAAVLGVEVGITDNFFDLGGHSLMAMRLIPRLKKELDWTVSIRDILELSTPAAMCARFQVQDSTAAAINTSGVAPMSAESYIHIHRRENSRATFVLVHGYWGQASIFDELLPLLDPTLEIMVITDPFFAVLDEPSSMEAWAKHYLEGLKTILPPDRRVFLAGYSLGGLITFKMATLWHQILSCPLESLLLLECGSYVAGPKMDGPGSQRALEIAFEIFGPDQREFILQHWSKRDMISQNLGETPDYHGAGMYMTTNTAKDTAIPGWWKSHCPQMDILYADTHHRWYTDAQGVLNVGAVVNAYLRPMLAAINHPSPVQTNMGGVEANGHNAEADTNLVMENRVGGTVVNGGTGE